MDSIDFGFTSGSSPRPGPTPPDSELAFPEAFDYNLNDDTFTLGAHSLDNFCLPPWNHASSHVFSNGGTDLAFADESLRGLNEHSELDLLFGLSNPIPDFNTGCNLPWSLDVNPIWHGTGISCQPESDFAQQNARWINHEDNLLSTPRSIEEAPTTVRKARQHRQIAALPTPPKDPSSSPRAPRKYKEKKHACPNCGKFFRYPKDVQRHHECVHENRRPLQCPHETCKYHSRGFNRKDALERHMRVHGKGNEKQQKKRQK